jgi:cyclophilin family peptidyl-prolyl cis-trans isomerase
MRSKMVAVMVAGLFLAPAALAQQTTTGPQGLAEPTVPGMKDAPAAAAPTTPTPAPAADPQNILDLDISTGGRVQVLLRPDKAPNSVERIKTLVRRGFYNGLTFHRVIEGFMAQTGDPKGDGTGGSELPNLKAEFNDMPHLRGEMSMARAEDNDSANSQFFIMFQPNMKLDGKYTAVGRVIAGMAYVDAIERGEPPANPSKILQASIDSDHLAPPPMPAAAPAAATPAPSLVKPLSFTPSTTPAPARRRPPR